MRKNKLFSITHTLISERDGFESKRKQTRDLDEETRTNFQTPQPVKILKKTPRLNHNITNNIQEELAKAQTYIKAHKRKEERKTNRIPTNPKAQRG